MQKTRLLPYIGAYFGGESVDKSMKMTKTGAVPFRSFLWEIAPECLSPTLLFYPSVTVQCPYPRRYVPSGIVRNSFCFPSSLAPSSKRSKKNQKRKEKERKKNATPYCHRWVVGLGSSCRFGNGLQFQSEGGAQTDGAGLDVDAAVVIFLDDSLDQSET